MQEPGILPCRVFLAIGLVLRVKAVDIGVPLFYSIRSK